MFRLLTWCCSCELVGPAQSWLTRAVLDTAGDDTVFPDLVARRIGLDLTNAPAGFGRGAGLAGIPLKYAQIVLRLTDGREFREWPGWVGFTPAPLFYPMLGFAGCLQFFAALFLGDREEVELTVNSLYPGT
jgi:hypothetical protein